MEALTEECEPAKQKMIKTYQNFWSVLETSFNTEGSEMPEVFWKQMFMLGSSIGKLWQTGMCPDFNLDAAAHNH